MNEAALRHQFLSLSLWFMSGMACLAWVLSEISDTQPLSMLAVSWRNAGWGCAAAMCMVLILRYAKRERQLAVEAIGAQVAACRWQELAVLAAIVGFCEEWLFRGVLELWMSRWNAWGAMVLVNVLFGLLHALSLRYALLAGGLGVVMSLLTRYPEPHSLLRPMVAHGVYDFIGFLVIASDYRKQNPAGQVNPPAADNLSS